MLPIPDSCPPHTHNIIRKQWFPGIKLIIFLTARYRKIILINKKVFQIVEIEKPECNYIILENICREKRVSKGLYVILSNSQEPCKLVGHISASPQLFLGCPFQAFSLVCAFSLSLSLTRSFSFARSAQVKIVHSWRTGRQSIYWSLFFIFC